MIDGYFHLDGCAPNPLADLGQRLASAGIQRALVVETWAGKEKPALDEIAAHATTANGACPVAYCIREQTKSELASLLDVPVVRAIRARTADLESCPAWLALLERSGRILLCHGESGVERLTHALVEVARAHPQLRIYVPHLGWPRCDKRDDPEWPACIATLAALPNAVLGISALAHFSNSGFPHDDLRPLAQIAIEFFGARRLVAATDYPLIDKPRYSESYHLARSWISERWPEWNDTHALRA